MGWARKRKPPAKAESEKPDRPETRMESQPSRTGRCDPITTGVADRYVLEGLKGLAVTGMNLGKA